MIVPGPGRYLAPLALIAAVVAVVVVLGTGGSGKNSKASTQTVSAPVPRSRHHFWIVRPGQTLSLIATRTKVRTDEIKKLNPGKDLSTLRVGEQVRVRP